ncbi:MAG: tetratricopeptide repeat protein [Parafilimonas sp.]
MKKIRLYIIVLLFNGCLFAQDVSKIPNLKKELKKAGNDSDRADVLTQLCFHYSVLNTDTALLYGEQAMQLSKKIQYKKGIGDSYNNIGWVYFKLSNMRKAEEYFKTALSLFKETGRKDLIVMPVANLGTMYMDETEYTKSLECFMQAVKLDDEIIDNGDINIKSNKAATLHDIGRLYNLQKNSTEARKYFEQALKITKSLNADAHIAENLMSIGNTYQIDNNHQKALQYYYECLKYIQKTNDLYRIGLTHENMGVSYFALAKYSEAIKHFNLAKENYSTLKSKGDMFYVSIDLAQVYDTLKNTRQAIASLSEALQYANELKNKNFQQQAFSALSDFYRQHENYKSAYNFLDSSNKIKDSLFTIEKQDQLLQLQTQFETEQKEKQIELLKKDQQLTYASIQRQKTFQYAAYIIFFLLVLIGFLIINRYRTVQRAKRVIEMEQMRNNIARNLHDDIGSTLTSINILSKVALQTETNDAAKTNMQKIKDRSAAIMESMSDIVWAINPANDALDKIILRMKEFGSEITEQAGIQFIFKEEEELNDVKLSLAQRNNLYLIFKEAVNNAVKYSEANEINISLKKEQNNLILKIKDNGKGFNAQHQYSGNGLKNLQSRANDMQAKIQLQSTAGKGTTICLFMPIT